MVDISTHVPGTSVDDVESETMAAPLSSPASSSPEEAKGVSKASVATLASDTGATGNSQPVPQQSYSGEKSLHNNVMDINKHVQVHQDGISVDDVESGRMASPLSSPASTPKEEKGVLNASMATFTSKTGTTRNSKSVPQQSYSGEKILHYNVMDTSTHVQAQQDGTSVDNVESGTMASPLMSPTSSPKEGKGVSKASVETLASDMGITRGSQPVPQQQSSQHGHIPGGINLPAFMHLPTQYTATKPPKETLKAVYGAGRYKAGLTLDVLSIQSFMAGIYISMAGQIFLSVGGGVLGAALFPTGLYAVILTSAELFTGDALIFIASLLGRQVRLSSLLRNWAVSWTFNFVGAMVWAALIAYASEALEDLGQADYAIAVALKKANQPFWKIFVKGIGANFMVCLAVWQATCAEEVSGKILAMWFPIAGFVIMGLEHCIANQFFITLGMMLGANISVSRLLFMALLPATLGNIVGGGIFIGAVYWYVFDSMESLNASREKIRRGWSKANGRGSSVIFRAVDEEVGTK